MPEPGLYRKFEIRRIDGRDAEGGDRHGARYFVLDVSYDHHARSAVLIYASEVADTRPALAADLRALYGLEPSSEKRAKLSDVFAATEDETELGGCATCGDDIELGQRVVWVPFGVDEAPWSRAIVLDHLWCAVQNDEIDLGLDGLA